MDQIAKIVEASCKGISKDPREIATLVTREQKNVYLVHDVKCPSYSFLMILSERKGLKNNYKNLGYYVEIIEKLRNTRLCLEGIFSVKNHHDSGYEAVYLWSNSAIHSVILYSLGIRIWKKIISNRGSTSSVNSLLSRLKKVDSCDDSYDIREGMEFLPYEKDVKIITVGVALDEKFAIESVSIANYIAEVNRDIYSMQDAMFDEMHKLAKIFGLRKKDRIIN